MILTTEQVEAMQRQAQEDAQNVTSALESLLSTSSNWSGRVVVQPQQQLGGLGFYFPNNDIGVAAETFDRPHFYWPTIICEAIHGYSPNLVHSPTFHLYPGLEEGANEMLQRLLRPQILERLEIQLDPKRLQQRDEAHPFNRYIRALEAIRMAAGRKRIKWSSIGG